MRLLGLKAKGVPILYIGEDAMARPLLWSIAPLLLQRIHLQIQVLLKSKKTTVAYFHRFVSKLVYIVNF